MGVVKIRHRGPVKDNYAHQFPLNYIEDELAREDRFPSGEDHNNDPDESNFSDSGCEYALVNDHILSIPFELYELANLKDILCLETWNFCLTEEERFHLAAYLPDMDQETFELTIIELLRGDNLYFGSPLEILFHRLKGGFYSLQVTRHREGLRFLHERRHYHSLRSYHNSLGQKFVEMRRVWHNSRPNTSVEERVQILKEKRNQNLVYLVDLNAFPHDAEHPSKVMGIPRKTAFINDEERVNHGPPMDLKNLNSRRKAKGVLKLKTPEASSTLKKIDPSLHSEIREPYRRPPKGVLKVKPKSATVVESLRAKIVLRDRTSDSIFCSKLSPHSAPQSAGDGSIYRGSPMPKRNSLSICSRPSDNAPSISGKMSMDKGMRKSSSDSICFEDSFGGWKMGVLRPTSSKIYPSALNNAQRKPMPLGVGVPKSVVRNSITTIAYPKLPMSPDHSEYLRRDELDGEAGVEEGCRFPITYKRKKPHTKLNTLRNQKQPPMVSGIAPAAADGTIFNQVEKTKTIRIRVKGWNDYRERILDGQHYGSPSMYLKDS
ncbi:hypothetical protein KSP39_PZI000034 [Platanthera zijinensis]|uniref:DEUBAD domain-containing protein n=1 Tax=Platanthera zijinensis TaxID=2320716 RepID=A0AAP0C1X1_9ASPA